MERQKRKSKRRKKQRSKYTLKGMLGFIAVVIMVIPLYQSQIIQNLFSSTTKSFQNPENKTEKQVVQEETPVVTPKVLSEDGVVHQYISNFYEC